MAAGASGCALLPRKTFRGGAAAGPGTLLAIAGISLTCFTAAGCGSEGIAEGATASVYVTAPLCGEAEKALAEHGAEVGEVRLEVRCLPAVTRGGRPDLAAIGAGARQATEDSTAIAYIGPTESTAVEFSKKILEEAGIARISTSSGARTMAKLIKAVDEAGRASNLRASVNQSLGSG